MSNDLIIGLVLGFMGGIFLVGLISTGVITGFGIVNDCNCDFITRNAEFEMVGSQEFDGAGFGNGKFDVKIKNLEEQAAKFKINMLCNTATDSRTISSEQLYIQPQQTEKFRIIYDVGLLENWRCIVESVEAETISTCEKVN